MRIGAPQPTEPAAACVLCDAAPATCSLVPSFRLLHDDSGQTVEVSRVRLCERCRHRVVIEDVELGWSWRARRWGPVGQVSPAADVYAPVPR